MKHESSVAIVINRNGHEKEKSEGEEEHFSII